MLKNKIIVFINKSSLEHGIFYTNVLVGLKLLHLATNAKDSDVATIPTLHHNLTHIHKTIYIYIIYYPQINHKTQSYKL